MAITLVGECGVLTIGNRSVVETLAEGVRWPIPIFSNKDDVLSEKKRNN